MSDLSSTDSDTVGNGLVMQKGCYICSTGTQIVRMRPDDRMNGRERGTYLVHKP